MSYVPFYRATNEQRLDILANDIERVAGDVNEMIESGDLTLCKLLKVQALMRDLQTKAQHASKHA
ncbi:TPA: hypothetical protein ACY3LZ_004300 [Citrobacter freundii]|uniref:hypothetical protein n=1 Tax=Citrobacter freundii complex TaxID=1344959 RepID=UPI0012D4EBC2|nr:MULTISPECIES: hypothetical protein [Citrobacter freundii complex]ECZ1980079.1 hypothetical protein [Salmonella enterica]MDK2581824.1 hypothetical protein [Citrobacter portucalensis]MDX7506174.1 hypothetical protein [Citrobacter freundii]HAK6590682.1 hypothetical protein [Salmonella enterica]HAT2543041.1 hypothetical protein [Citrobacter freundii]